MFGSSGGLGSSNRVNGLSELNESVDLATSEYMEEAQKVLFESMLNGLNFMKRESENTSLSKILKEGNNINW